MDSRFQISRRALLGVAASAMPALAGQDGYAGVKYRSYSRCLPDYLKELAGNAARARLGELAKLGTPESIAERQKWARQTFWRLIGGGYEKTPLNAKVTGTLERDGYRVQKVTYESRPGFHITANFYVPLRGRRPFAGILFQMGHAPNGKAWPAYQRCCQALVKLGYAVLAFDPMGQGERIYYPDASLRRSRLGSPDEEHTNPGKQLLLVGHTSTRLQLWDAVRSLDYLASQPMVDPKRIATAGQSGGGTLSMFLACCDDRLAAAAVMSGNTENFALAEFQAPGSTDDAEQNFINAAASGFDRWDTVYPFAPKPLLISVSDKDSFGTYSPDYIENGWAEYQHLKKVYQLMGKPDHLHWSSTPLPHSLSYDSRLAMYNFFQKTLRSTERVITEEPPTKPEPDETLWATESGNTLKSLSSTTPFQIAQKQLGKLVPVPLDRLLKMDRPLGGKVHVLKRVPSGRGVEIEAIEVQSAGKVWVPLWLFLPPDKSAQRPLLLLLEPSGRNGPWHEDELYQTLAAEGFAVAVLDVRGIGDLAPEIGQGNPRYTKAHSEEEDYAWASLILGKPLLGQRTTDVLAVIRALKQHPVVQNRQFLLAAQGRMTPLGQVVAALDPGVVKIYLSGGLASFRKILETENFGHPFANFVPDILNHTDLPEITAGMGRRKVILAGMLDGGGRRIDTPAIRKMYERTQNLEVLDQAQWNLDALRKFAVG